jgi:DNA (cytosine-5)-methyltransferase 1
MIIGSVCSGIGGAELAFKGIAEHAFMAETDPFARTVLTERFPSINLYGDFTGIRHGSVDVLVGGTPCQSFSIAGLRGGLADERGNLALEFLRLAHRLRPRWIVWENVPGVLSSGNGRDLGAFLGGLVELGYGFAYRVLDAQYFGLAQRRSRVFVVGYIGDWRRAAAVLFEPASLRGDTAPRRETRKDLAPTLASRASAGGGHGTDFDCDGGLVARALRPSRLGSGGAERDGADTLIAFDARQSDVITYGDRAGPLDTCGYSQAMAFGGNNTHGPIDIATAVRAKGGTGHGDFESETFITGPLPAHAHGHGFSGFAGNQEVDAGHLVAHTLRAEGFDGAEDGSSRGTPLAVIGSFQQNSMGGRGTLGYDPDTEVLRPVKPQPDHQMLQQGSQVRRLTPLECERLQGFPDGWTAVTYRGKPAADGNRYRALGNAFAVPTVRWIARRIVREDSQ